MDDINIASTYRGFRKQCIYILWRILTDNSDDLQYQPEQFGDMSVFSIDAVPPKLLEIVEVKDRGHKIGISDFSSAFLERTFYAANHDNAQIRFVSFSDFNQPMTAAFSGDSHESKLIFAESLIKKTSFIQEQALYYIEATTLELVEENVLMSQITELLEYSPTAPDTKHSIEILLRWIYQACEDKATICKNDILKKLNDIGSFIQQRAAHIQEWGTAITSFDNVFYEDTEDVERLKDDFKEGRNAKLIHIKHDCDIRRDALLTEMHSKLQQKSILIIHGASGQGKSTLAYRYIWEYCNPQTAYEIINVSNIDQALNIATAISGYVDKFGTLLFYLDVKPTFIGWRLLLERLQYKKGIKIIVSVREEDMAWAGLFTSGQNNQKDQDVSHARNSNSLNYSEIGLGLNALEAKSIYDTFCQKYVVKEIATFEEAWEKFGQSGPLLEFMYLLSHQECLKDRLREQIQNLINRSNGDKIVGMLRIISFISSYGASCRSIDLLKHFDCDISGIILKPLEEEYFVSIKDGLIEGLHIVRSRIVSEIISSSPSVKQETAFECLPLVNDDGLFIFLINLFNDYYDIRGKIIAQLSLFRHRSWLEIRNIMKALLWLGVKEYSIANSSLIKEIYATPFLSPVILLDFQVANPEFSDEGCLSLFEQLCNKEYADTLRQYRIRQTPKSDIYKYLSMLKGELQLDIISMQDFSFIGEILFWSSKISSSIKITDRVISQFVQNIENIPSNYSCDFFLGLFFGAKSYFERFHGLRSTVLKRLQDEYFIQRFDDDGTIVSIEFIIPLGDNEDSIEQDMNSEAMNRLRILRNLYPDRVQFNSQGYGHIFWGELVDKTCRIDVSHKAIPIKNFYLEWDVELNHAFLCFVENYNRPDTWDAYVTAIAAQRNTFYQQAEEICQLGVKCIQEKKSIHFFERALTKYSAAVNIPQIALPKCLFGELGFDDKSTVEEIINNGFSGYQEWQTLYHGFTTDWNNFLNHFASALKYSSSKKYLIGTYLNEEQSKVLQELYQTGNISFWNLYDFYEKLKDFQNNYSNIFSRFTNKATLEEIENRESFIYRQLVLLWNLLLYDPENTKGSPIYFVSNCKQAIERRINDIQVKLNQNNENFVCHPIEIGDELYFICSSDSIRPIQENSLTRRLCDSFNELSAFHQHLFVIYFRNINLVLTCGNYSISGEKKQLSTRLLLGTDSASLENNDILHNKPLVEEEISCLKIAVFETDAASSLKDFIAYNFKAVALISHLHEIVSHCNSWNDTYHLHYIHEKIDEYNQELQLTMVAATNIEKYFQGIFASSPQNLETLNNVFDSFISNLQEYLIEAKTELQYLEQKLSILKQTLLTFFTASNSIIQQLFDTEIAIELEKLQFGSNKE